MRGQYPLRSRSQVGEAWKPGQVNTFGKQQKRKDGKWEKKKEKRRNSRELFPLFNFYSYNIFCNKSRLNSDMIIVTTIDKPSPCSARG